MSYNQARDAGIGAYATHLIGLGFPPDAVIAMVKLVHPESRISKDCVATYKSRMKAAA